MRVIEGHQLQGDDIKPVVTVLIGEHRFRTRIRAGNNPYYNEVAPGDGDPPVSPSRPSPRSQFCPILGVFPAFPPNTHPAGSSAHPHPGWGQWHLRGR